MSQNVYVHLPGDTKFERVLESMAMLAGLEFGHGGIQGAFANTVVQVPGMLSFVFDAGEGSKLADGDQHHSCYYHFEGNPQTTERLIGMASTPFWRVMGKSLVDFWGGWVCFNDHLALDKKVGNGDNQHYASPKPRKWNNPERDPEWTVLMKAIRGIRPITRASMYAMEDSRLAQTIGLLNRRTQRAKAT